MTTGLVDGKTLSQAADLVREKAIEQLGTGSGVGLWTETGRQSVMVGLALAGRGAVVVTIPRAEYNGLEVLQLVAGISLTKRRTSGGV
ncbi:MAG: hypothetical protein ABI574_04610 [Burkholderiales bacterium]